MMARDRGFLGRILHVAIELPSDDDAVLAFDFDFGPSQRPVQMPDGQHAFAPPANECRDRSSWCKSPAAIIRYRRRGGNRGGKEGCGWKVVFLSCDALSAPAFEATDAVGGRVHRRAQAA